MDFQIVYASQLEQVLRESRGLLIDIRESEDYNAGHWPGAINYPYEMFESNNLRLPRNRKMILYCEHGGGSMQLARHLGREGYRVATVVGGYEALKKVQETYFKNRRNV